MISMKSARNILAALWLSAGGLVVLIVSMQELMGQVYQDTLGDVWKWVIPTIVPTMTLVIGVLVTEARTPIDRDYKVNNFLFRVTFALSLVYLVYLLIVILVAAAGGDTDITAIDRMRNATYGVNILQGLVALSLGAFFVQSNPNP